ncbi:MAG: hypothetical protein PHT78_08915 [Desulfitobacteriaceae bacterium]|nr:hypothetical protein [Desulfitobacteriaceae bacterium]
MKRKGPGRPAKDKPDDFIDIGNKTKNISGESYNHISFASISKASNPKLLNEDPEERGER